VYRDPQLHGQFPVLSRGGLNPHESARGMLTVEYDRRFPDASSVRGARFTVSVSPTRGRLLLASNVAGSPPRRV
jgi:hypothetical protein